MNKKFPPSKTNKQPTQKYNLKVNGNETIRACDFKTKCIGGT
jgi:hypothetical protein